MQVGLTVQIGQSQRKVVNIPGKSKAASLDLGMMYCQLALDFLLSVIEDDLSLKRYKANTAKETCLLKSEVISDSDKKWSYYINKIGGYATNFCLDVD